MPQFKIGVQLYTVRDFCTTAADLTETLKKVAKIGYKYVEASPFGPLQPAELKNVLDGEGLSMPSTHLGLDAILQKTDTTVETLLMFDCKHIALSGPEERSEDGYLRFAEKLSEAANVLAPHGIQLSYHNHHWEFERYGDKTGIGILVENTDPQVGFQLDTYWVQEGGGDPIQWIRKVSGRIPFLHAKDMTIIDAKVHMAEVGEGNLNWEGIFSAAKEAGTEWVIVEQDFSQRDPFESIEISLRNLESMGVVLS